MCIAVHGVIENVPPVCKQQVGNVVSGRHMLAVAWLNANGLLARMGITNVAQRVVGDL